MNYFLSQRYSDLYSNTYTTKRDGSIQRHGLEYACIRTQKSTDLPSGVPNHIFDFPSEYGLEKCGNNYIYYTNYPTPGGFF